MPPEVVTYSPKRRGRTSECRLTQEAPGQEAETGGRGRRRSELCWGCCRKGKGEAWHLGRFQAVALALDTLANKWPHLHVYYELLSHRLTTDLFRVENPGESPASQTPK